MSLFAKTLNFGMRISASDGLFPNPIQKPRHLFGCHLNLCQRSGEATAEVALAARPECAAGHARYLLLLQQFHREFLRTQAGGFNIGKRIEGSPRQMTLQ